MREANPRWIRTCRAAGVALIAISTTAIAAVYLSGGSIDPFGSGEIYLPDSYFVLVRFEAFALFAPALAGLALVAATFSARRGDG